MSTSLINYFPNYLSTEALFTKMSVLGAPWGNDIGQDMDDAYFTMYSGFKPASNFVVMHSENSIANALTLARILWGIYGKNWTRLWEAYLTTYVPIQNYDMKETVVRSQTNDRTVGKTTANNSTVDGTTTTTYGENVDTTGNRKDYTVGFNSSNPVPRAEADDIGTEAHSGSDDVVSKDITSASGKEDTIDNDEENENIETTRFGNIGVTTTQQMLQQEIELWKWNFFHSVFDDVDRYLVLSVFTADCPSVVYVPVPGPAGKDGSDGQNGHDATINGVNTLQIVAGSGMEISQDGNVLTLISTGGGGALEYSTIPRVVGKWIDDSDVWEVTIVIPTMSSSYQNYYSTNLTDVRALIEFSMSYTFGDQDGLTAATSRVITGVLQVAQNYGSIVNTTTNNVIVVKYLKEET